MRVNPREERASEQRTHARESEGEREQVKEREGG